MKRFRFLRLLGEVVSLNENEMKMTLLLGHVAPEKCRSLLFGAVVVCEMHLKEFLGDISVGGCYR